MKEVEEGMHKMSWVVSVGADWGMDRFAGLGFRGSISLQTRDFKPPHCCFKISVDLMPLTRITGYNESNITINNFAVTYLD